MDLPKRIIKARLDAKMTQSELAKAVGVTRGAVAQWESESGTRPRHSTLLLIAAATKKPILWFQGGNESGLPVVGEVGAGMWREATVNFDTWTEPVAPHPDYPANAQRLYRIQGNSINRVAQDGEYLHAVNLKESGLQPEHGDLVIVRRVKHDLAEYTAKQLVLVEDKWVLRPESHDPKWQHDLVLDCDDGTEIEITDIVIAKWSPIPRRRPVTKWPLAQSILSILLPF